MAVVDSIERFLSTFACVWEKGRRKGTRKGSFYTLRRVRVALFPFYSLAFEST